MHGVTLGRLIYDGGIMPTVWQWFPNYSWLFMCKHAKVECQQISSANLKIFSFSRKFISGGGEGVAIDWYAKTQAEEEVDISYKKIFVC